MSRRERVSGPQPQASRWGQVLRAWRCRRELSLAELGAKVFYDHSHLAKFERGERIPPRHVVEACDRELDADGELIQSFELIAASKPEARAGERADGGAWDAPAQLPADVVNFTGRAAEMDRLDAVLAAGVQQSAVLISAVSGMAGVGKTTLVVHWAHRVADRFPDGQLYVNLRGFDPSGSVMNPSDALRQFLEAFGVSPERIPIDRETRAALYRSLLTHKRVLVVLDNAHDAEQVRPLLPGSSGCMVIVTSRNDLCGLVAKDAAEPLPLDLPTAADAHTFMARRLGRQRVAAEPSAVEALIELCARLPLALGVVTARATTRPQLSLAALVADLRATKGGLEAFAATDAATDLRAVFDCSLHALRADAARLFRLLALHPGPDFSASAAASLAGYGTSHTRRLLSELTGAHLLVQHAPGRYEFHDLLRAYAVELVQASDSEPDRRTATARMLDHYVCAAQTAAAGFLGEYCDGSYLDASAVAPPTPTSTTESCLDQEQALAWFATEHAVLTATLERAASDNWNSHTWRLAHAIELFLDMRGHWNELFASWQKALKAGQQLDDQVVQTQAHAMLGHSCIRLCRYEKAGSHYQQALELATTTGSCVAQAHVRLGLSWLSERLDQPADALHHARLSYELYRATGHPRQLDALYKVGWYQALLGNHRAAVDDCQQALALQDLFDRPFNRAATLRSLGFAYHHLADYAAAISCYQEALGIFRKYHERYYQAELFCRLGDVHRDTNAVEAACVAWRASLEILEEVDHPDADQVRAKLASVSMAD